MAIEDEVKSRYSNQRLVELTNPGNPNAATIDGTRLTLAATDARQEFELMTATAFDINDATHVAIVVEGVLCYLMKRTGLGTERDQ